MDLDEDTSGVVNGNILKSDTILKQAAEYGIGVGS